MELWFSLLTLENDDSKTTPSDFETQAVKAAASKEKGKEERAVPKWLKFGK